MNVFLNEIKTQIDPDFSLFQLRDEKYPLADILIVNGFPVSNDLNLSEGDHVVMIQRGVQPSVEELEALMMARHTPGVHAVLKESCVGIAGVGGLGSAVVIALARSGIGRLIIADMDVVEPSNLNRQQYFVEQIGKPKVHALKETLQRINPGIEITARHQRVTAGNLTDIFGQADILVEAFDSAAEKAMLANAFLATYPGRPLIAASGVAGYAASNTITTKRISNQLILCGDDITAAEPGCGLMAPRVGIAAHHQANAVLRYILGAEIE